MGVYYYLNVIYLIFDLYPFIHTQLDLYTSNAHELSTVTVRNQMQYVVFHLIT